MIKTISTAELEQRIRNTRVIDLRDLEFYYLGHIEGACWLPFLMVTERAEEVLHPDEPVVFYDSGREDWRALDVVETLVRMGYDNVWLYPDGWTGWQAAHPSALVDSFAQR